MNLNEEKILIDQAKRNPRAFGILYDVYYKQIFGYVFRRVGNYEIARDITSETFLKAFIKINSFKWQGISISAWFYRIATNEINQFLRAKRYTPSYFHELFSSIPQLTDTSCDDTIKERIEQEEQQYKDFMHVQQQIKLLPVKYQEVITLKYFENKNTNEISENGFNSGRLAFIFRMYGEGFRHNSKIGNHLRKSDPLKPWILLHASLK